jgi:hypothetical protein
MLPLELLAVLGAGALFPYLAESAIDWLKHHGKHSDGADAPN